MNIYGIYIEIFIVLFFIVYNRNLIQKEKRKDKIIEFTTICSKFDRILILVLVLWVDFFSIKEATADF